MSCRRMERPSRSETKMGTGFRHRAKQELAGIFAEGFARGFECFLRRNGDEDVLGSARCWGGAGLPLIVD